MVGQRYWRAVKVCLFVPLIASVAISTAVSGKGATPSSMKEMVCAVQVLLVGPEILVSGSCIFVYAICSQRSRFHCCHK